MLFSEQIPNDGSFQLSQILKATNEWLTSNGKHGKTAKIKVVGKNLAIQFSFNGKQINKGIGVRFTIDGIEKAKRIALLVSNQLELDKYSEAWLDELLGKKPKEVKEEKEAEKTCKELLVEYKNYWFKEKISLKSDVNDSWNQRHRWLDTLEAIEKPLTNKIIQDIILSSKPNSSTRSFCIQSIKTFLNFHCLEIPRFIAKLESENKPKSVKKHIPTDNEIEYYLNVFMNHEYEGKGKRGYSETMTIARKKLTFIYKLLAIYGLRIHEVFEIANWNKPVTLKNGDWITVEINDNDDNDENEDKDTLKQYRGNDFIIPAITDKNNKDKILAIKHDTKTGYRMAMPISPSSKDWIIDWNLIEEKTLNELLPDWKNETKNDRRSRSRSICKYFRYGTSGIVSSEHDRFVPFTPHCLRHAYNHRGHSQGINPSQLAQSLGHSLQMNSSTYLRTMREETKLEGLKNAFSKELNKVDEVEQLKAENKALRLENERLREQLKMIQTEKMLHKELDI